MDKNLFAVTPPMGWNKFEGHKIPHSAYTIINQVLRIEKSAANA